MTDKVSIDILLNELDQNPDQELEVDRYTFPLFNRLLNERGFKFHVFEIRENSIRCKVQRILSET